LLSLPGGFDGRGRKAAAKFNTQIHVPADGEKSCGDEPPLTLGGTLFKFLAFFIVAVISIATTTTADAAPKSGHRLRQSTSQGLIICDNRGCSDQRVGSGAAPQAVDANGNGIVVGRRPAGCPYEFCGCEASLYLFGEIRAELNLASNWARKFPRTSPAPGMVAARNHHVMVLMSHVDGRDWLVHDGNSGGGLTREHVMSISGYTVVDPHGSRSAQRLD
jgi:hypothetical protein